MSRGKKYKKAQTLIESDKFYDISDAIDLVLKTSVTKFDSTVELHINLGIDPKKSEQQIRSSVMLPHGSGKQKKVAVFADGKAADDAKSAGAHLVGNTELIEEIKKTGKADFDVAIAVPKMMKELAKIARILGPKGLMPSPKADTVTDDVVKAIKELAGGKVTFKNDRSGVLHLGIGKVSFGAEKIKENFDACLEVIKKIKPEDMKGTYIKSITLSSSMGPGVKVKI